MVTFEGEPFLWFNATHVRTGKNTMKLHGSGQQISHELPDDIGIIQAFKMSRFIVNEVAQFCQLHDIPADQTKIVINTGTQIRLETTAGYCGRLMRWIGREAMGTEVSVVFRVNPDLRGIDMGDAAGMDDSRLKAQFPDVASQLRDWFLHKTNRPPDMPGGEKVGGFYARVARGMTRVMENHGGNANAPAYPVAEMLVCPGSVVSIVEDIMTRPEHLRQLAAGNNDQIPFVNRHHGTVQAWLVSQNPPVCLTEGYIDPGE